MTPSLCCILGTQYPPSFLPSLQYFSIFIYGSVLGYHVGGLGANIIQCLGDFLLHLHLAGPHAWLPPVGAVQEGRGAVLCEVQPWYMPCSNTFLPQVMFHSTSMYLRGLNQSIGVCMFKWQNFGIHLSNLSIVTIERAVKGEEAFKCDVYLSQTM